MPLLWCEKRTPFLTLTFHGLQIRPVLQSPVPPKTPLRGSLPNCGWPGLQNLFLVLLRFSFPLVCLFLAICHLFISSEAIHFLLGQLFHQAFSSHKNLKFGPVDL